MTDRTSGQPGERWLVNLRPVDNVSQDSREATATLIDFDARTQTWSVEEEGADGKTVAIPAAQLIRKA